MNNFITPTQHIFSCFEMRNSTSRSFYFQLILHFLSSSGPLEEFIVNQRVDALFQVNVLFKNVSVIKKNSFHWRLIIDTFQNFLACLNTVKRKLWTVNRRWKMFLARTLPSQTLTLKIGFLSCWKLDFSYARRKEVHWKICRDLV